MKRARLTKEDAASLEEGWPLEIGKYILFMTPAGWNWAVSPHEADLFDPEEDMLEEYLELDADETEIVDSDDWEEEEEE